MSPQRTDFTSSGCIPIRWTAGPPGNYIFSVARKIHGVFNNSCINIHSPEHCTRFHFSPLPYQHLLSSFLLITVDHTAERQYLIVFSICICLMTCVNKKFVIYPWTIYIISSEKEDLRLLISLPTFWFFFFFTITIKFYTYLDISSWTVAWFVKLSLICWLSHYSINCFLCFT